MKIIHFSDTHIDFGAGWGLIDSTSTIPGRVLDCLDMIDSIIDFAVEEDVDLIIFAGDAFHKYNPNPLFVNEFAKRIIKMKQQCPVVMLVGNHDMSPTTSSIEIYKSLEIDGIIVGNDYQVHRIKTKVGYIQVATAPYPSKAMMRSKTALTDLNDKVYSLGNDIVDDCPAVLVGHFTVGGAQMGAERSFILGTDAQVPLETLADPVWDYVALGHIHYHQCLNEEPPVVYSGSTDRVTFGEEHEEKGFVLINIDNDKHVTWEFILLDARPYITIEVSTLKADPNPKILSKIDSTDLKDAVVRVIIKVQERYFEVVDRQAINDHLDKSGMYFLASLVIYKIKPESETRFDTEKFNASTSHDALLLEYLENKGIEGSELNKLMAAGRKIIDEVKNA